MCNERVRISYSLVTLLVGGDPLLSSSLLHKVSKSWLPFPAPGAIGYVPSTAITLWAYREKRWISVSVYRQ